MSVLRPSVVNVNRQSSAWPRETLDVNEITDNFETSRTNNNEPDSNQQPLNSLVDEIMARQTLVDEKLEEPLFQQLVSQP